MEKLNIVILHDQRPPEKPDETEEEDFNLHVEDDVADSLKRLGHTFEKVAVDHNLKELVTKLEESKPDLVVNIAETFGGKSSMEPHIIAVLEMLKIPYTGSNMWSIMLNGDKSLQKRILSYHGVKTPDFTIFPIGSRVTLPKDLVFPLIVKPAQEDSSIGIHECSVVKTEEALTERVKFLHNNLQSPAVVEKFIEGREFYVGVLGDKQVQVFPLVELDLSGIPENKPKIATFRVKWNIEYREKMNIQSVFPKDIDPDTEKRIADTCTKAYKVLGIQNYARIDVRLSAEDNEIYVLEANPNPWIAEGEDLANAAEKAGLKYDEFITKILKLGISKNGSK
ncbi:ATP-grasp domain-containing protein [Candidatus Auribacterota bacterium]